MLADYISSSIIALVCYPFLRFLETQDVKYLYFGVCLIAIDLSTKVIKYLTRNLGDLFTRPELATGCDILCREGPCGNKPGFPSGHMTTAAFFSTVFYLTNPSVVTASVGISIIIATAWARYIKNCHNVLQICAGGIYGVIGGAVFYIVVMKSE